MRRLIRFVYDTWYGASAVCILLLAVNVLVSISCFNCGFAVSIVLGTVSAVLSLLLVVGFLNLIFAIVLSLFRRKWILAAGQFAITILTSVGLIWVLVLLSFFSMFGPSEDHFADDIRMPTDIKVTKPENGYEIPAGGIAAADSYSVALTVAATNVLSSRGKISCDISELDGLYKKDASFVRRYWASHPGWRFSRDRFSDRLTAYRRVRTCGHWHVGLCIPDVGPAGHDDCVRSIMGECLALTEGVDWDGIKCRSGDRVGVFFKTDVDSQKIGTILCKGDAITLMVRESSCFSASRVMQPIFDFTQAEFAALRKTNGDWDAARELLPNDAIRKGESSMTLFGDGGRYSYDAWVNPGEEGEVYLKAFEVTKGTRLSETRIKNDTREYVGWSDDPSEKFLASSSFTIYEGDLGKYYAARIEIWFIPARGGDERKLVEGVFRVEGWQR